MVDANVLFSALIRDSQTRKLILNPGLELFAPQYLLEELSKYKKLIHAKSRLTRAQFAKAVKTLLGVVQIVDAKDFEEFLAEAVSISPDKKDSFYFALCLAKNIPLWSNDKQLKKQRVVRVYSTHELKALI